MATETGLPIPGKLQALQGEAQPPEEIQILVHFYPERQSLLATDRYLAALSCELYTSGPTRAVHGRCRVRFPATYLALMHGLSNDEEDNYNRRLLVWSGELAGRWRT